MNNPKTLKVVIAILAVALFTSLVFLGYAHWQNYWWKNVVLGLAYYEGATRAENDFKTGKLRRFAIRGERDDDKYSGSNEGPFEIWYPAYHSGLYALRYSADMMIDAYNSNMRIMHDGQMQRITATNRLIMPLHSMPR